MSRSIDELVKTLSEASKTPQSGVRSMKYHWKLNQPSPSFSDQGCSSSTPQALTTPQQCDNDHSCMLESFRERPEDSHLLAAIILRHPQIVVQDASRPMYTFEEKKLTGVDMIVLCPNGDSTGTSDYGMAYFLQADIKARDSFNVNLSNDPYLNDFDCSLRIRDKKCRPVLNACCASATVGKYSFNDRPNDHSSLDRKRHDLTVTRWTKSDHSEGYVEKSHEHICLDVEEEENANSLNPLEDLVEQWTKAGDYRSN